MFKKLKPGESEDDILRMSAEFNAERAKNPGFQPAAAFVRADRAPKKSMFAQRREQAKLGRVTSVPEKQQEENALPAEEVKVQSTSVPPEVTGTPVAQILMDEIQENILGDVKGRKMNATSIKNVLGEIVERPEGERRPSAPNRAIPSKPRSIFGRQILEASSQATEVSKAKTDSAETDRSSLVKDSKMAQEIHEENLNVIHQMSEQDILAERERLLASMDPSLIALLTKKRQTRDKPVDKKQSPVLIEAPAQPPKATQSSSEAPSTSLPDSSPALELLQLSDQGNWVNFNLVEDHKLAWMRDIPAKMRELKPGQQFNARFDWKGVLLPHTLKDADLPGQLDERELYLHGEEADRPGYTLQELFRLARSTVLQQRISAFGAVAGIFSIYSQGFYDQVLTLPISKIFFLLRYGLDDNAPAQLEVVSRSLANLFYNETDEILLDHVHDNAYCHWQPTLQVLGSQGEDKAGDSDPDSIAFLQRYMKLLTTSQSVRADVDEDESENRMSMDDFQLAETDLIDCLLRTNVLQRIRFILDSVKPENSTVESCLKLLIRIARTNIKVARQLADESYLLEVLFTNFLPPSLGNNQFYGQPQTLFLKLIRVLTCQHLDIAKILSKGVLIARLQQYLFSQDNKGPMVRVQIEALRLLRCLLILGIVNRDVFRQFLPALRQLLGWHCNHCAFGDVGGSGLVRQHAAALLAALVASGESGVCDVEGQKLLLEPLNNCCCSWLHAATRMDRIKDFSQMTLLSAALYAVSWFSRNGYLGPNSFQPFLRSILPKFVQSSSFIASVQDLAKGSIMLRRPIDRRHAHAALPNVGAVLMHDYGPQLILSETYPVHLLSNLWTLLAAVSVESSEKRPLFDALMQPAVLEPLAEYLRQLSSQLNRVLAANFFARSELRFIHQLLTTDGMETYLKRSQLLQLVYNYLCCLSTAHAAQIKSTFERFIFNGEYVKLDEASLKLLQQTCLEIVYPHIIADNSEPSLSLSYTQTPILPADWPFFQMRLILSNYLQNVQQQPAAIYSENQVVRMTFSFVRELEREGLQVVSPFEKLMYLMIAFMGPDSQFLEQDLHELLRDYLMDFYEQNAAHDFEFDAELMDKARFEPLYYLFVEHFEAASYGDELFSSLVLLPLAQKYDNKWRRRLWSEHVQAVRFLNCDESLLIGGLSAYLEPVEEEPSLVQLYGDALEQRLVRPGSIAFRIAQHHFNHSKSVHKAKLF
ncbi:RNA polymerase II-associated protein 1 [Drosophila serrata]|uniref:RNA polymerase II-associated protein 1 n=1 Tax=Drosophila serrata TaxID=7274 RepID=UPI000A1D3569|nr:RNA polymerase II-associated protein 1 [Drosophila serrata]XP_020798263.1 RNA polymerase II-associated protein 1 [Drosophila serrata]